MKDGRNREIDYLRISITDRCNLNCIYCMPKEGVKNIAHNEILSFEEIERLCKIFVKLGIHKFKITGGEPLVRKNCEVLVNKIHKIEGVESITMTTNGVLLPEAIDGLVTAGLDGVNISLDAMNPESYEAITRSNKWKETMEGIQSALRYPSLQIKINCVPLREMKEDDLIQIAELARFDNIQVRFIEMMPIGLGSQFQYIEEEQVRALLENCFGEFSPCIEKLGNGPAHYFNVPGFKGKIGFISARTHKFCDSCNRIRLTSEGFLKTCLQFNNGCELKQMLRGSFSDNEIETRIKEALYNKPESHHFEETVNENDFELRSMNHIGG